MSDPKFSDMTQSEIERMFSKIFRESGVGGGSGSRTPRPERSQAEIRR